MSIGIIASQAFVPTKLAGLKLWLDATDENTVIKSLPDEFINSLPEGYRFINEEPLIDDIYDDNGNTLDNELGLLMKLKKIE